MTLPMPENPKGLKLWMGRLMKLAFVLIALLAIFVTILANMGGSSDNLKDSAANFIGATFGGKGDVKKLAKLSFFPRVGLDVEGVQVTRVQAVEKTQSPQVLAGFEKVQMYMDFWDVVFGNPRFRTFFIEDGFIRNGVYGAKNLTIERAYTDHDEQNNTAKVLANGLYGKDPWTLQIGVDVRKSSGKYEYEINDVTPFVLDVADIHVAGVLAQSDNNFMRLQNFEMMREMQKISGDIYASMLSEGIIKFKGFLKLNSEEENINFDLLFDFKSNPTKVSGALAGKAFSFSDIFGDQSLKSLCSRLYEILRDEAPSQTPAESLTRALTAIDIDVKLNLADIVFDEFKALTAEMRILQDNGHLIVKDFKAQEEDTVLNSPITILLPAAGEDFHFVSGLNMASVQTSIFEGLEKGKKLECFAGAIRLEKGKMNFEPALLTAEGKTYSSGAVLNYRDGSLNDKNAAKVDHFSLFSDHYKILKETLVPLNYKNCLDFFKADAKTLSP